MQFLFCLLFICQSVCLWHTAAELHLKSKSLGRLSHESVEESSSNYADYKTQLDADNNQLEEEELQLQQQQIEKMKVPAVQVKVTNEVESAMTMMGADMQQQQQRQEDSGRSHHSPNGNRHETDMTDTQNVMPSIQEDDNDGGGGNLMSPNTLPISSTGHHQGHNLASNSSDGQMANDEQLLRLQDYNLLYNAERQTYFQLHTTNKPSSNRTSPSMTGGGGGGGGNRLLHQVVGNTLSAAFGLNANINDGGKDTLDTMTTQTVQLYDAASLRVSNYNPFQPTRILIHGWLGNAHANVYSSLVPAYLKVGGGQYNIFTVDWGRGAIADYITASYRVKPVGQVLAKFLDFLHVEAGMRFEDLQLIGFSMGAHVAGLAAKHVQTGRVPIIRALDPALPFFRYAHEKERLSKMDADYVEVLHTSAGSYGFDRPLGHVDFYANWGSQQPGCFWHECSHWRAFALFKESLQPPASPSTLTNINTNTAPFEAEGCLTTEWPQLTRFRQCRQPTGLQLHMGGDLAELSMAQLALREGVYHFETNAHPPYDPRSTF